MEGQSFIFLADMDHHNFGWGHHRFLGGRANIDSNMRKARQGSRPSRTDTARRLVERSHRGADIAGTVSGVLHRRDFEMGRLRLLRQHMFTLITLKGHDITPPIWNGEGRFFPLGHQEFNLIRHFTNTVFGYHVLPIIQLWLYVGSSRFSSMK